MKTSPFFVLAFLCLSGAVYLVFKYTSSASTAVTPRYFLICSVAFCALGLLIWISLRSSTKRPAPTHELLPPLAEKTALALQRDFLINTETTEERRYLMGGDDRCISDTSFKEYEGFQLYIECLQRPIRSIASHGPNHVITQGLIAGSLIQIPMFFTVQSGELSMGRKDFEVGDKEFDDAFKVFSEGDSDAASNLLTSDVRRGLLRLLSTVSLVRLDNDGVRWEKGGALSTEEYAEILDANEVLALALRNVSHDGATSWNQHRHLAPLLDSVSDEVRSL